MKSILAVLFVAGLAAALQLPPKGAVSGILKDLQQKLTKDVSQVTGHAKEDYQLALQHVQEASKAVSSKAPKDTLHLIKENLKQTIHKISSEAKADTHSIVEHLKEAYLALKAAVRPQNNRILRKE